MSHTTPLLHRLLNVHRGELPRITLAWILQSFLRIGYVMGWTVTLAIFIHRMGIEWMPFLFAINAILVMGSSLVYAELLKKVKKSTVTLGTVFLAAGLLIFSTLFVYSDSTFFLGGIILAQGLLLSQLTLLVNLFIEDLFSPMESQRSFPLISSAEMLGGVMGGGILVVLGEWMIPYKFIYLWALLIMALIPLFFLAENYLKKIPSLEIQQKEREKNRFKLHPIKTMAAGFKNVKKNGFVKSIAFLIFFQVLVGSVLEFQYTKAVEKKVLEQVNPIAFEVESYQPAGGLSVDLFDVKTLDEEIQIDSLEHELTNTLALLQMSFFGISFLIQVILGSRLLKQLGMIGSFMTHVLISIAQFTGMTIRFDFFTAALSRSSFEVTSGFFKTAYHSSYYVLPETVKIQIKETMEGMIKPMGTLGGFLMIFFIQKTFAGEHQSQIINLLLLVLSLAMVLPLLSMQKNYLKLAIHQLKQDHITSRLNAIEILGQQGDPAEQRLLLRSLNSTRESTHVKQKILTVWQQQHRPEQLSGLIERLRTDDPTLKEEILEVILGMENLKEYLKKKPFLRHRTIETIQRIFQGNSEKKTKEMQNQCIELLAKIDEGDLVPFLLQLLGNPHSEHQRAVLWACRHFRDIGLIPYLKPYLKSKDPFICTAAAGALWRFQELKPRLQKGLEKLKKNEAANVTVALLELLQEIGGKKDLPYLLSHIDHPNEQVREAAYKALYRQKHPEAIPRMIELLRHENPQVAERSKKYLRAQQNELIKAIERLVHIQISHHIHSLIDKSHAKSLMEMDKKTLEKLKQAYATVDEYEEMLKIEAILHQKKHPHLEAENPDLLPDIKTHAAPA